jgi:hypothetical protein
MQRQRAEVTPSRIREEALHAARGNSFAFQLALELIMCDIRLSDEQRQFQKLARDFAQNEIKPGLAKLVEPEIPD